MARLMAIESAVIVRRGMLQSSLRRLKCNGSSESRR
jgi:hypothetical protein